jgi:hypothetical protein
MSFERRGPGDEEPEPPAEERAHLLEHEPVREGALRREQRPQRLPLPREPGRLEPHLEGPAEDRRLGRAALARVLEHLRVELEAPGDGAHEGRARRGEVLDDLVHPAGVKWLLANTLHRVMAGDMDSELAKVVFSGCRVLLDASDSDASHIEQAKQRLRVLIEEVRRERSLPPRSPQENTEGSG